MISAPGISLLRQSAGAAAMFAIARPKVRGMDRRQWSAIAGMGGSTALMSVLFLFALTRVPLGIATALVFSGPCVLAITGDRRRGQMLGALVATIGVALLAPWGDYGMNLAGLAIAGLAGVSYSAFLMIANRAGTLFRANEAAAFSLAFSALLLAPVGVVTDGADLIDGSVVLIVGLTSIISTVIPNMLEFRLTRRITAQLHGVLVSLNPAVAALVGAVLLSQSVGNMSLVAVASISGGAALAYWASREQRTSQPLSNAMAN